MARVMDWPVSFASCLARRSVTGFFILRGMVSKPSPILYRSIELYNRKPEIANAGVDYARFPKTSELEAARTAASEPVPEFGHWMAEFGHDPRQFLIPSRIVALAHTKHGR